MTERRSDRQGERNWRGSCTGTRTPRGDACRRWRGRIGHRRGPLRLHPRLVPWARLLVASLVVGALVGIGGRATTASAAGPWYFPFARDETWQISCGYGCYWHTGLDAKALDFSWGEDYNADCGRTVLATGTGTVRTSTCSGRLADAGYGCHVEVAHPGGQQSLYAHLKEGSTPRRGTQACRGASVGRVGKTGSASTCHLHFHMTSGGAAYTPEPMRGRRAGARSCMDLRGLGVGSWTSCTSRVCE
jgi:hypothetical protein